MNKLKKILIRLSLVFSSLCLNFNAFSSNLNDLPDDLIKNHLLPDCELACITNYLNISGISKKFNVLVKDQGINIFGRDHYPGINTISEFENTIKALFKGEPINISPSINQEFNNLFKNNKLEKNEISYSELIFCDELDHSPYNNFVAHLKLDPNTETRFNVTFSAMSVHKNLIDSDNGNKFEGILAIFMVPNSDNASFLGKEDGLWPFKSINDIYHVYYRELFPNNTVEYVLYGEIKDGRKEEVIYRFFKNIKSEI